MACAILDNEAVMENGTVMENGGNGIGGAESREVALQAFAETLGHSFRNLRLLDQALTHASSTADPFADNERLEFFGDAILDFLVGEHLFLQTPERDEGWLTQAKSEVVCRESLALAGEELGVRPYLHLGRGIGQRKTLPDSVYANAYEALVAAVYLDGGMEAARAFVLRTLGEVLERVRIPRTAKNHKSLLQEALQKEDGALPFYELLDESGPEHAKTFRVAVRIAGDVVGVGSGPKKKDAEQDAARAALEARGLLPPETPANDPHSLPDKLPAPDRQDEA